MKICSKCQTKNNSHKKKCTYCGASLNGVKNIEDDAIYKPVFTSNYDFIDEIEDDREPKPLSEQFGMLILLVFLIGTFLHLPPYFFMDDKFVNFDTIFNGTMSILYYIIKISILNYLILVSTLHTIFKKSTVYEDDAKKFILFSEIYFIVFSIYLATINYLIYFDSLLFLLNLSLNLVIFFIYVPIINRDFMKKLL